MRGVGDGEAALVAQGDGSGEQEIPAEVRGWVEGAKAAYIKGDAAEALRLQLKALAWVNAQPRPLYPFRAQVLNNLGVLYSNLGQRSEALQATQEAEKIFRELARTNPAFLPALAGALNILGVFYWGWGQRSEALQATQEAEKITRELARTNPAFLPALAGALNILAPTVSKVVRSV